MGESVLTATYIAEATNRFKELVTWHLAAPLIDHDGGDEDDRFFKERQFLRAIRKPSHVWREGDRLYYIRKVELKPLPFTFMDQDPGDESP